MNQELHPFIQSVSSFLYSLAILLISTTLSVSNYLLQPVKFLLQPAIHLNAFILDWLLTPFRFLARLETLYIYFAIASIVGLTVGVAGAYTQRLLSHILRLYPSQDVEPKRSIQDYRKKRQDDIKPLISAEPSEITLSSSAKALSDAGYLSRSMAKKPRGSRNASLLHQCIMEDSDDE
ncbi:hypothetical protein K470DRAFT_213878 [Piedraia hortae CBS 480.64]|uniref:Uncharacterized protein n=1 Tax=Piedraia hortae CBS 480.64 TaxID=1314780 RepID=A0A6A7C3N4_9PEZI|nr:hypothetical protein K470DRAFT_213878 [Piedraia hortae CBS 480.64]